MKKHSKKVRPLSGTLLLAALILSSCNTNWPQFRGPDQNMVATGRNLPDVWNDSTSIRWEAQLEGDSWTSPVIWGNRIFVSAAIPVKTASPPERQEGAQAKQEQDRSFLQEVYRWEVSCYDLRTGELLWKQVAREGSPRIKKHSAHNYAAETPVCDGKQLYVYFGMMGVYCYDLTGNLQWEKDLGSYKTLNDWGTGSSPVLYDGLLYVQADNEENSFLVALNSETGEQVWRRDRDEKTNYSTPFIWKNSLRTELVAGGKKACSYDPQTGELLWELKVGGYYNIPSPVADEDYIYLGNTAWRNIPGTYFCVKAGSNGDITPAEGEITSKGVIWSDSASALANPSPLLYKGLLYMISSRGGTITCLDAASGEQIYQEKIEGTGGCWPSPWVYEDKIYFTDEKGVTRIFKAGKTFELVGENHLDDKFWTSIAVASDAYVMKGTEKLYCIGY